MIALRLSTIKDAHQIPVINQGERTERGTHDEVGCRGVYYDLYICQFKGRV